MKTFFSLPILLGAGLLLGGCAFKSPPWQDVDGKTAEVERLDKAKQACDHDTKLKRTGEIRANPMMIARYEGRSTSGPMATEHFDKAAKLRQEVWDCMKEQGFFRLRNRL